MTGIIGWSPGTRLNPSVVISLRKYLLLAWRRSLSSFPFCRSSSTFRVADAIDGASELEKR